MRLPAKHWRGGTGTHRRSAPGCSPRRFLKRQLPPAGALAVLAAMMFVCPFLSAQQASPYVIGTFGAAPNMGFQGIMMSGGVGFEVVNSYLFARAEGTWNSSRKQQVGGESVRSFGEASLRLSKSAWAGAGIGYSRQITSAWTKSALHPRITGGYSYGNTRLFVAYILPGDDRHNHVQGLQSEIELPIAHRIAWIGRTGFYRFHATDNPADRRWGTDISFGIRLWLNQSRGPAAAYSPWWKGQR